MGGRAAGNKIEGEGCPEVCVAVGYTSKMRPDLDVRDKGAGRPESK